MGKRGRRYDSRKEEYWRDVVRRCEQSGQSVRAFCAAAGVKESAFYWWRGRLVGRGGKKDLSPAVPTAVIAAKRSTSRRPTSRPLPPPTGGFVPVQVVMDRPMLESGVEICLPGGRRVAVQPGFDGKTLADVLAVLEVRPC